MMSRVGARLLYNFTIENGDVMNDIVIGCSVLGVVMLTIVILVVWSVAIINRLGQGGEKTVRQIVKAGKDGK